MSQLSNIDPARLATLAQIRASGQAILLGQITRFSWPGDVRYYTCAPYDRMPEFAGAAQAFNQGGSPVSFEVRLTSSGNATQGFNAYITELSFDVDVTDSKVPIELSNGDGAIEDLYLTHGWGVPVEIFYYFPQADLLVSRWFGYLDPVTSASNPIFKATASSGFRSGRLELPNAAFYPHCVADFPPEYPELFPSIGSISGNDCPYDAHFAGGTHGIAGFTTCDRSSDACKARFGNITNLPYLGFDSIQINDGLPFRQDSRTIDQSRGNSSNLSEPVRVIFGHRVVKDQDIVEFTIQVNNDHPERGSVTVTTIGCEGPVSAVTDIQLNNIPVDSSNYKLRLGAVQQSDTTVIPATPIPNFSSRQVTTAVQKGDFRGAAASGLSVRSTIDGLNNIRIYTGPTSFTRGFTTNPAWCLLEAMTNRRWGMGIDVARLQIQDFLDLAAWFSETVGYQNADGTRGTITRAAFNAEWRGRKAQDQLRDFCLYRRTSLPFPFEGRLRIIKLDQEVLDQDVPVFNDRWSGAGGQGSVFRNILPGQDGISSADWREIPIDQQVNRIIFKFDDASLDDMAERPLLFEDLPAQRAAGKAAGDNTLIRVQKEHFGTGITELGEAVRQGNVLMDLGEFDEGGLVNPVAGSFTTSLLDALTLHPYKVIQVDSYKFDRMKAKYGFQYFRVMKIRQNSDLTVNVDIQAYPDAYYATLEDDTTGTTVRTGGSGTPIGGGPTGGGGGPAGGPGFRPKPVKILPSLEDDDGLTFAMLLL